MLAKKRVLIPLANGVEELEAVAAIDYLRRAGCHVVTASVSAPNPIVGRNRIRIMADIDIDEALDEWGDDWDLVALPGGAAVAVLQEHEGLMALLRRRLAAGGLTGAICAAPLVLAAAGLDAATRITSFPGVRDALVGFDAYDDAAAVVHDGAVITSRGAGTSVAFALACVEALLGPAKAREIAEQTVTPGSMGAGSAGDGSA